MIRAEERNADELQHSFAVGEEEAPESEPDDEDDDTDGDGDDSNDDDAEEPSPGFEPLPNM